jgi:peptidoglycan hydrolase-like protein with peptidoglycan-binding domain
VTAPTTFQASYVPAPPDAAAYTPAKSNVLSVAPGVGLTLSVVSYLKARHKAVGVRHVRTNLRGTVSPYAAGQRIEVDIFSHNKRVVNGSVPVRAAGARGTFTFSFKPKSRGVYTVRASQPGGSASVRVFVVRPHAHQGSRGTAVRALQSRLAHLGYLTPVNGYYNSSTSRAVLAFRKVNGYARTTSASSAVFKRLARGGGAFHVRYPQAGKHVEFDWSRQVLVLARGAKADKILHASSGKPSTPTVFGKFQFYSKTAGFNSHGMYYSNYFIGGYAIHGYAEVPSYAASHGCIRIPIPSAIAVFRWVSLGDTIYVYH